VIFHFFFFTISFSMCLSVWGFVLVFYLSLFFTLSLCFSPSIYVFYSICFSFSGFLILWVSYCLRFLLSTFLTVYFSYSLCSLLPVSYACLSHSFTFCNAILLIYVSCSLRFSLFIMPCLALSLCLILLLFCNAILLIET
jgi:hypothetical protein